MRQLLRRAPSRLLIGGRLAGPQGLRVDWNHPLARGLLSFCLPDGNGCLVDLATPRRGAVGTTAGFASRGPTLRGSFIADAQSRDIAFTAAPFSVACSANVTTFNFGLLWGKGIWVSDANNQGWEIQAASGGTFRANVYNNVAASSFAQSSGTTYSAGDHTVGFTNDGTTRTIYVDGRSDGASTTLGMTAASSTEPYGNDRAGVNAGTLYWGAAWARTLTADEMRLLHFDPTCLLIGHVEEFTADVPPIPDPGGRMFAMFPP